MEDNGEAMKEMVQLHSNKEGCGGAYVQVLAQSDKEGQSCLNHMA